MGRSTVAICQRSLAYRAVEQHLQSIVLPIALTARAAQFQGVIKKVEFVIRVVVHCTITLAIVPACHPGHSPALID